MGPLILTKYGHLENSPVALLDRFNRVRAFDHDSIQSMRIFPK